jgi:hypothetical protein
LTRRIIGLLDNGLFDRRRQAAGEGPGAQPIMLDSGASPNHKSLLDFTVKKSTGQQ